MNVSKYWRFVKLDSTNKRRIEMITAVQTYFQNQFTQTPEVSDAKIVRQLWQQMHQGRETSSKESHLAEICLRCCISHQIDQVCADLGIKFGIDNGFNREDLLPFVLPDEVLWANSQQRVKSSYKSLATSLLETFNPDKGSLHTWVKRYVKQHPELKKFLLEHGVFLISDWALLNDISPQELQRILAEMYNLATLEIQQRREILISYHTVYREDRLQQRMRGMTLPCQPPTSQQLTRIADDIKSRTGREMSHEFLLNQLQGIAAKIRRYKIVIQGGSVSEVSFDQPEIQPIVEGSHITHEDEEENKFLQLYQDEFINSLDQAISQVINDFIAKIQRKPTANKNEESLLNALQLFHCQGQSMSQIAPQIGFRKQYEVTRFLKLNQFRADIRQRLLRNLRDRVVEIAGYFTNSQSLEGLDKKIESILDEQILTVMQEAESEVKSPVKNQAFSSLFARRLCRYLEVMYQMKVKT
ncbi:MAG: hypothetical protein QNJ47_09660 [Nostocaceae cyanobacterium]|nr:hypothetical protein [Nostocaceae cyanobacterium]